MKVGKHNSIVLLNTRRRRISGGVVEWFIAPVLKTGEVLKPPWVRIPPPPPNRLECEVFGLTTL